MPPLPVTTNLPDIEITASSKMRDNGKPQHLPFDKRTDTLWLGDGWHAQSIDLRKRIPKDLYQKFDNWNRRLGFLLRAFDPNDDAGHGREWQYDILQEATKQCNLQGPHPSLLASGFVSLNWVLRRGLLHYIRLHQRYDRYGAAEGTQFRANA